MTPREIAKYQKIGEGSTRANLNCLIKSGEVIKKKIERKGGWQLVYKIRDGKYR